MKGRETIYNFNYYINKYKFTNISTLNTKTCLGKAKSRTDNTMQLKNLRYVKRPKLLTMWSTSNFVIPFLINKDSYNFKTCLPGLKMYPTSISVCTFIKKIKTEDKNGDKKRMYQKNHFKGR